MVTPIAIKDVPEKFRAFLDAGDNHNDSDKQTGVINSEEEAVQSLDEACIFSSEEEARTGADTCLELADYFQKYGGYETSGHFLYYRANALSVKGHLAAAAKNFDAIIARNKERVSDAWAGRGVIAYRENKIDIAKPHFLKAVEIDPKNANTRHWLIQLALEQDRPQEALEHAQKAAKLTPGNSLVYYNLARTLRILGRFDEALREADRGLKFPGNSENANAHLSFERALALSFLHRFKEAIVAYRAAGGSKEVQEDYFYNLKFGKALAMAGQYDEALRFLEKAHKLNGKDDEAIKSLVPVCNNLRLWNKSKKYYEAGLTIGIDDGDFHYLGAIAYFSEGELDKSISAIKKALNLSGDNEEYKYFLAIAEGRNNLNTLNFEQAITRLKEAISIFPDRAEAYGTLLQAMVLRDKGLTQEADGIFKKVDALCKDKECKATYKLLHADAFALSGDYDRALAKIASLEKPGMGSFDSDTLAAGILFMSGNEEEAESHLKKAEARANPSDQNSAMILAMMRAVIGLKKDPDLAVQLFKQQMEKMKGQVSEKTMFQMPIALLNIVRGFMACMHASEGAVESAEEYLIAAGMLFNADQHKRALPILDKYIAARPKDPEGHYLRGRILQKMIKAEEASKEFKTAIDLGKTGDAPLRARYGISLADTGRHEEALKQYDEALRINPEMKEVLVKKCIILLIDGKLEESLKCIDKTIKETPKADDAYRVKADIMLQKGRMSEAMDLAKKALELNPDNFSAIMIAAKIHLSRNEYEQSINLLKRAMELEPYDKLARVLASQCMFALKRIDEAKVLIKNFEAMFPDSKLMYLLRSIIEAEGGNYEEALRLAGEAETLDNSAPHNFVKSIQRAQVLSMMGRFSEANGIMENTMKEAPEHAKKRASFFNEWGKIKYWLHKYKEALQAFKDSAKIADNPAEKADAMEGVALSYMALKEHGKALSAIEEAARLSSGIGLKAAKAAVLMQMGRKVESLKIAESVLKTYPDNAYANIVKGYSFAIEGKFKEALPFAEKAFKSMPYSSAVVATLGSIYSSLGRTEEAVTKFKRAIELNPSDEAIYFNLGLALNRLNRTSEALGYLNLAEEKGLKDPRLYYLLGDTYFDLKNYKEALIYFDKWIASRTDSNDKIHYHEKAGWIFFNMQNYSEARSNFEKILTAKPATAAAGYYGLASIAIKEGDTARIEGYLQEALRANPDHAGANNELAIIRATGGKMDEALYLFDKAISSNSAAPEYYYNKAFALISIGRFDDALKIADKFLGIVNDREPRAEGYLLKAFILSNLGKYKLANEYCDQALNSGKDAPEVRFLKAYALTQIQKFKDAAAELDRAIQKNGGLIEAYALRGLIYMENLHDYGRALADFEETTRLDPENPAGYYYKAKVLYKMGRYDESLKVLNLPVLGKWDYSDPYLLRAMIDIETSAYEMALDHIQSALDRKKIMDANLPSISNLQAEILLEMNNRKRKMPPPPQGDKMDVYCKTKEKYCKQLIARPDTFGNLSYLDQIRERRDCWNIGKKLCNFDLSKDDDGVPNTILPDIAPKSIGPFQWKNTPPEPPKGMDRNWNMRISL